MSIAKVMNHFTPHAKNKYMFNICNEVSVLNIFANICRTSYNITWNPLHGVFISQCDINVTYTSKFDAVKIHRNNTFAIVLIQ